MRVLRPAEWVLVCFVAYGLCRVLFASNFRFHLPDLPRTDMLITFLGILTARLAVSYRKLPWPDPSMARRHWFMLIALAIPSTIIVVGRRSVIFHRHSGGTLPGVVEAVHGLTYALAFTVVPPLFFWLFLGLRQKRIEDLDRPNLLRDLASTLGRAARDWLSPLALIFAYGFMGAVLEKPLIADQDDLLARIDMFLFFGHSPNLLAERLIHPALSEWFAAAYVFYAFLFPLALGIVYAKDEEGFKQVSFALTFTLAVGYVGYTLVPAQGPLFLQHFEVPLDFYYLGIIKEELMDRTRVPRDCFPSLHTAASLVLFWGLARSSRISAIVISPLVLSIPFACIYLRYHYVTDVIAGVVLFVIATRLTKRLFPAPPAPVLS